jgi:septum formation protein
LKWLRVPFEILVPQGIDEGAVTGSAEHVARTLAARKAEKVLEELRTHGQQHWADGIVLGADTVVATEHAAEQRLLGKPRNLEHARQMIVDLSGRSHRVVTGVAVARQGETTRAEVSVTEVRFRPLPEEDIGRYLQTGEYVGKAGAYGIQGKGRSLIAGIRGCYYNVVGLPLRLAARMIGEYLPHSFGHCDCGGDPLQLESVVDCDEAGRSTS